MARPYILRKGVSRVSDLVDGGSRFREEQVFFVDSVNGSDANSGLNPDDAYATMDKGIDQARYKTGTTTIDDTKSHHTLVLVAPGHYNEALLFSGYNITVEGMIAGAPGKDYGVCVNYDGSTDTTAALGISGSGICLRNLWIECQEAIPGLYIAGGDNNLIENCVISGDDDMTYGIHAASLKGTSIRNCVINGFATAGIWFEGGADRYAIQGEIVDCNIHSDVSGAEGILIDSNIVSWAYRIARNHVDVLGGGSGSIGIDVNYTGNLFVTDNRVRAHTTAIDHEGEGALWNHCSEGAAGSAAYALIDEDDM